MPDLDDVTAILLAAGLWTTAADLVSVRHRVVIPAARRSRQRRAPAAGQAAQSASAGASTLADGIAWEAGDGPGGSASLIVRLSDNHAYAALTNRKVPIMGLNRRVFRQGS